jgi:RNA polymerase sigma factor (sigma-70 family)
MDHVINSDRQNYCEDETLKTMQTDRQLAERLAEGSNDALGEIFARYGDRLHDYCHSVVRSPHDASDAVQETFLLAAERVGQLRDPAKLRPWLYAIARNECLRRVRNQPIPVDDFSGVVEDIDLGVSAEDEELSSLIADAAAGLDPRDRAVLDLQLRHDLEGGELADALGVKLSHSYVLVGRVRERVERSLAALLVARRGRRDCGELHAVLGNWDGTLSPRLRKRLARHIDDCEICERTRARAASPLALLASLPLIPAPRELHAYFEGSGNTPQPRSSKSASRARSSKSASRGRSSKSASMALQLDAQGFPQVPRGRSFWMRGFMVSLLAAVLVAAAMLMVLRLATDSPQTGATSALQLETPSTVVMSERPTNSEPAPTSTVAEETTTTVTTSEAPLDTSAADEPDVPTTDEPGSDPDTVSPLLQDPRLSSGTLLEDANQGCRPTTATLWVYASDAGTGIEEVVALVTAGTYESTIQLEAVEANDDAFYQGTIGPFPAGIVIRASAGINIEITAFDYARNEASTGLVAKLVPC